MNVMIDDWMVRKTLQSAERLPPGNAEC